MNKESRIKKCKNEMKKVPLNQDNYIIGVDYNGAQNKNKMMIKDLKKDQYSQYYDEIEDEQVYHRFEKNTLKSS